MQKNDITKDPFTESLVHCDFKEFSHILMQIYQKIVYNDDLVDARIKNTEIHIETLRHEIENSPDPKVRINSFYILLLLDDFDYLKGIYKTIVKEEHSTRILDILIKDPHYYYDGYGFVKKKISALVKK